MADVSSVNHRIQQAQVQVNYVPALDSTGKANPVHAALTAQLAALKEIAAVLEEHDRKIRRLR